MASRKSVLLTLSILGAVLVVWEYVGNYQLCDFLVSEGHQGNCPFLMSSIETTLLPILPMFVFSIITYWMREEIYVAWFKFARWWIPLSMVAILISPEYSHDWMFPIEKGTVAFMTSVVFVIASSAIIGWKYFRK